MMSMSIRNAKMNFSKLLVLVERGEEVIIRNRQKPIARITSIKESEKEPDSSTLLAALSKLRSTQKMAPKGDSDRLVRADRDGRD